MLGRTEGSQISEQREPWQSPGRTTLCRIAWQPWQRASLCWKRLSCWKQQNLQMADGPLAGLVCRLGSMRVRTEVVRPQQGGILALAGGSWKAQSRVSRMSSFLTSGLGTSGGEVFQVEWGGFRLAEAGLPNPEGGRSRPPPLWSVLGGQAGHEEELRTEHLPSLGPMGGPGPGGGAALGGWDGNAASPLASPLSPVSCSTLAEALPQEALNEMVANLMEFLLLKCLAKELTS